MKKNRILLVIVFNLQKIIVHNLCTKTYCFAEILYASIPKYFFRVTGRNDYKSGIFESISFYNGAYYNVLTGRNLNRKKLALSTLKMLSKNKTGFW
jgi:hypothetical protein